MERLERLPRLKSLQPRLGKLWQKLGRKLHNRLQRLRGSSGGPASPCSTSMRPRYSKWHGAPDHRSKAGLDFTGFQWLSASLAQSPSA